MSSPENNERAFGKGKRLQPEKIETERLILEELSTTHTKSIYDLIISSGDLHKSTHIPEGYTLDEATEWVKEKSQQPYFFVIIDKVSGQPVGLISAIDFDLPSRNAEIGFWLGKEFRGNGFANEALRSFIDTMFDLTDIQKIFARVFSDNKASIKTLEGCDFKQEGEFVDHEWHSDYMRNVLFFGITRS